MNVYTLYAVNYDPTTVANAMLIDGVSDFNLDPRFQEILSAADGSVDPTHVAMMYQDPRLTFSTTKLATVLAKASNAMLINGLKIDADETYNGCEFWFQKLQEGGTRAGAGSNVKMTVKEGLLLPRRITAAQRGVATMEFEAICTYDGTNEPIVIATSQNLEGSPSVAELFTLGKVSINGSDLDNVQSINIETGLQEVVIAGDGAAWPTYVAIMSRNPLITITTFDVAVLSTYGLDGTAQSASDSVIYLRKLSEGGSRVADATAQHVSITVDEGMIRTRSIPAPHGSPAIATIELRPTYDGENDILVINPAVAIS